MSSSNTTEYGKLYLYLLAKARNKKKNLSIFCHDSPDPDAMASALALQEMALRAKMKANIYYDGEINHSQNKAMINVLDINMIKLSDLGNGEFEDHIEFVKNSVIAVVDTSSFRTGNCLSPNAVFDKEDNKKPDIIIDHHGSNIISIDFILNKPFGSCATILTKALKDSKTKINSRLAIALYHGLISDSNGMKSKDSLCKEDHEIHNFLKDKIDFETYLRIVNCPKSRTLIDLEGLAKHKYIIQSGNSIVSGVGFINAAHRALLSEIADNLLHHDQIDMAVILGIVDLGLKQKKHLVVSLRNTGDVLDADEFIKKILGKDNSGGRKGAAGGQIELSHVLNNTIDEMDNEPETKEILFNTIFKAYAKIILNELQISV